MSQPENISPTAYATGAMWHRYGLSHPGLVTFKGRMLDRAFGGLAGGVKLATGLSFDDLMRARHLGIDSQLDAAIASGQVTQVVELAAGLSPRGWRYCQRYGQRIRYIETDLPHMLVEKQRLLNAAGLQTPQHQLQVLNVLKAEGEGSLAALAAQLDPDQGVAIITEGLMNYLNPTQARQLWRNIAATLANFSAGQYLSDFYLAGENRGVVMTVFGGMLQGFVRGRLHIHFRNEDEVSDSFAGFGFAHSQIHRTGDIPATAALAAGKGAQRVRVLEAWV